MSGQDVDKLFQTSNVRFFYQPGGACVPNSLLYAGDDGQYITIETAENPRVGGIEPHNFHHPFVMREYEQVARNRSAPGFPTASVMFYQKIGFLPQHLWETRRIITTFYAVFGATSDISNFATGWKDGYVKIFGDGEATQSTEKVGAQDASDLISDELPYTFSRIYSTGGISLDETAALQVYSEAISACYGSYGNGVQAQYVVANNTVASVGQAPAIYYRTTKNGAWTEQAITGAVSTDVPKKIIVVGQYLVVVFKDATAGGYFYTTISENSGIPNSSWSKVTTGFVSGKAPNDAFALSARQFYIVGDGGYIYKVQSIATGATVLDAGETTTNNLNKVKARGEVIIIGGASDTFLLSTDGGKTFTADTVGGAGAITAVEVINKLTFWVGENDGTIWYSVTAGETWTQVTLSSAIATVQDILFVTPEVGYILTASSAPAATVYSTINGGVDWVTGDPRLLNMPTFDRANQLVAPQTRDASTDCSHFIIAGLAGNGSDGIVLVGIPNSA